MRGIRVALAALVIGTLVPAASPQVRAAPSDLSGRRRAPLPAGWSAPTTGVAGSWRMSGGEFVYEDFLYDDTGADTRTSVRPGQQWGLVKPVGDYVYPTNPARYGDNAADLAELRIARRGDRLDVLARLNTLLAPDSTVVAIAFDTQPGGGVHEWPFMAKMRTPGTEHVLTLWGTGGAWDLERIDSMVSVDTTLNTITASIPFAYLGTPRFTAFAGTGLWNPGTTSWLQVRPGANANQAGGGAATEQSTNVWNVAFRRPSQELGAWFSDYQAEKLATPDISEFFAEVDLDAVDTPLERPAGLYERVHRTTAVGEGVKVDAGLQARGQSDFQGPTEFHFLGPDDISVVYVPPEYDDLGVALHGGGGNQQSFVDVALWQQIANEHKLLLVSPLAKGPNNQYTDEAELDVLDAMADVRAVYGLDPAKPALVFGHSMGGLGVHRMLVTRPDVFRAGVAFGSNTGDDLHNENPDGLGNGNALNVFPSLRNTPLMYVHSPADELEPYAEVRDAAQRLRDLGYMHRLQTESTTEHLTIINFPRPEVDRWIDANPPRAAPARVTYWTSESWWRPDVGPGLVFDSAWWVRDLRVRDTSQAFKSIGKVDATTFALGGSDPALVEVSRTETQPIGRPRPYVVEGLDYAYPGTPYPVANGFSATLANIGSIAFDVAAMGIDVHDVSTASLTSDGASEVLLAGEFPASTEVEGADAERVDGGIVLHIGAGTTSVTLRPDVTPPTVTIVSGPADPSHVTTAHFAFTSDDPGAVLSCSLDGAASGPCLATYAGLDVGPHRLEAWGTDVAGNVQPEPSVWGWRVEYATAGFESPVANPPGRNTGNAGRTYPLKWQLALDDVVVGDTGVVVSVAQALVSCITPEVPAQFQPLSRSPLRFDGETQRFVYAWSSPPVPGCYVVRVTLDDATTHDALFELS